MNPGRIGLLLRLFFRLEEHTAALSNDILAIAGACSRIGGVDGEALTLLTLLAGFSFLLVHDLHMINGIYLWVMIRCMGPDNPEKLNIRHHSRKRSFFS
jgi:hypothetical protein